MPFWTYQHLADVTHGTWLVQPDDLNAELTGLWHDTREIRKGQAYLAIKGDNFDGHDFVDKAFEAGAKLAIVQRVPRRLADRDESSVASPGRQAAGAPKPVLEVEDTVKALQDLARAYRDVLKQGGCKVVGIAGSNGKTTTRHLIHHVLTHAGLKGTQSPKSFNNHLGVPLTLLSGKPQDDFVACEIGTNHPGEIDFLSAIARPDIAVITSIGEEHLEFFKTIANVAKEEASILNHVTPNGMVYVPKGDWDRYLSKHLVRGDLNIVYGCYEPADDQLSTKVRSMGNHMASNIAIAGALADGMDISPAMIDEAVRSFDRPSGRGEVLRFGSVTVIHDAYNANPTSTLAAIDLLAQADGRKIMVFGDMLELGDRAIDAHRGVGVRAETAGIDHLIAIGELAKHAAMSVEQIQLDRFDAWTDRTPGDVADLLKPGDTVLLKASRAIGLERLIPAIERRFGAAQDDQPT